MNTTTTTTTSESPTPYQVRLEALRLAVVQAPGQRPSTWTPEEAIARARAFEQYLNGGHR